MLLTLDFACLASAALQSVFPQTELGTFMVLLKRDQEQQLDELTMIVTGIRLFNEATKRGEEEVDIHELSTAFLPIIHFTSFRVVVRLSTVLTKILRVKVKAAHGSGHLINDELENQRWHGLYASSTTANSALIFTSS